MTTGLLEKMNRVELEGVLAHELSHIKNYDILVMTLAVTMVGIIALLSDFFLRFMFWGGGRRDSDDTQQPGRCDHRASSASSCSIFSPIIARLMQFAVSRQREYLADASGVSAHPLSARAHLRAQEARRTTRPSSTPRRRRPRTSGSRSPSTRESKKVGREDEPRCSTRTLRSTTASRALEAM